MAKLWERCQKVLRDMTHDGTKFRAQMVGFQFSLKYFWHNGERNTQEKKNHICLISKMKMKVSPIAVILSGDNNGMETNR